MTAHADAWGQAVTCGNEPSVAAWNAILHGLLTFRGDPLGLAAETAERDPHMPMVRIFSATMLLLSGLPPDAPGIQRSMAEAAALLPHATGRERAHWHALQAAAAGNCWQAATQWDAILAQHPTDIFALKTSHEAFFIAGATQDMLASAGRALRAWNPAVPGIGFAIGQHAFALEESGHYAEAEAAARQALACEPDDLWSAHALAHVFEMQDRQADALGFLQEAQQRWTTQSLAGHMWWHVALRHLAAGDVASALAVHDNELAHTEPADWFRLTDATSLLWRLDLLGAPTGDRWHALAAKWQDYGTRHTSAFLDWHAAMALAKTGHPLCGFDTSPFPPGSELGGLARRMAPPLCAAMHAFCLHDWQNTLSLLEPLLPELHLIGGSLAQRQTVHLTCAAARQARKQALLF